MESWKFDMKPQPYDVTFGEAKYVAVVVMGGDGNLGRMLHPDLYEMSRMVSKDVAALVLVDYPSEEEGKTSRVLEVLPSATRPVEILEEINTGDPRPLSDFFARSLVSFSEETRFALGFWGHGTGVFEDYDPEEVVLSREVRFGELGARITEEALEKVTLVKKEVLSRSMMPDVTSENSLTNREASSALAAAFSRAGRTEPVDMVFFDTCLNSAVEVFTELRGFSKTFVASALLVPGTGWNYTYWLGATKREMPATAEEWAFLAAGTFGAAYDPRQTKEPAQMGAFSTSSDVDFVEKFAALVKALRARELDGLRLVLRSALKVDTLYYGSNVDLGQLVQKIGELSEEAEIKELASECWHIYTKALLGLSLPPAGGEKLTGMTVWCPFRGDTEGVSRYYEHLEFERLTGWLDLFLLAAAVEPSSTIFAMHCFWGLELVKAESVEETVISKDPEERKLWLSIPEKAMPYCDDLAEGEYEFNGGAGSIQCRNYVVLREFLRKLREVREGNEFEALSGCCEAGWVIGTAACGRVASELEQYEEAFMEDALDEEKRLFLNMLKCFRQVSDDGVVIFC